MHDSREPNYQRSSGAWHQLQENRSHLQESIMICSCKDADQFKCRLINASNRTKK